MGKVGNCHDNVNRQLAAFLRRSNSLPYYGPLYQYLLLFDGKLCLDNDGWEWRALLYVTYHEKNSHIDVISIALKTDEDNMHYRKIRSDRKRG